MKKSDAETNFYYMGQFDIVDARNAGKEDNKGKIILCKNADTDVVEYSLSRSLSQTMISEYKTKLIDKSILRRKLAELYDMAEEEAQNSQSD